MLVIFKHHQWDVESSSKKPVKLQLLDSFLWFTEIQTFDYSDYWTTETKIRVLLCHALPDQMITLFLTPGGIHTHKRKNSTAGIVTFEKPPLVIAAYQRKRWRQLQRHGLVWRERGCVVVLVWVDNGGTLCYSQAILPSKLERAMAKACTAHSG